MNFLKNIVDNVWFQRAFWSVVVILLAIAIYLILSKFLTGKENKNSKILSNKKNKTFLRMLKSAIAYPLAIFTVLAILQIYGVNITSMLAGVGIVGIVIGLALQDAMKDIFRGLEIISDNYYNIGDIVKYGDNFGQVLSISLRTTRIQDINTMNIVSIANRNINQIEVSTGYLYIQIPMPIDMKLEQAEKIMKEIKESLSHQKLITSADYQGITELTGNSINYQVVITCDPINQLQARRDALRVIIATLEENKVSIPHAQLDIHTR